MSEITTGGLDLAKNVFQAHGADVSGRVLFRKTLRRDEVLSSFSQLPPCTVAMEACGGAHFGVTRPASWAMRCGLIPPACVKPFVKRQKNDAADAEANQGATECLRARSLDLDPPFEHHTGPQHEDGCKKAGHMSAPDDAPKEALKIPLAKAAVTQVALSV